MVALETSDVNIHRNCKVTHVNMSDDINGSIQSIELLKYPDEDDDDAEDEGSAARKRKMEKVSGPEAIKLACFAFLGATKSLCSVDVFSAVNDSGLVYDGGIVVDKNFRTVDPWIYAVGDTTRFSRYFTDMLPHSK